MALAHHRHKLSALMRRRIYMVRTMLALILVTLVFAVLGGISISLTGRYQGLIQSYTSDFLKIKFDYPNNYVIEDNRNVIYIKPAKDATGSRKSDIEVFMMGSSYDSAYNHAQNTTALNRTHIRSISRLSAPYDGALVKKMDSDGGGVSYYFLIEGALYIFSTDNPSLFSDLDAIAQSFRIIP